MFGGFSRAITHPRAGPAAILVAIGLAGALTGSLVRSHQEEAFLKARIAALAARDASQIEAELVSCRATVKSYAAQAAATAAQPVGAPAGVEIAAAGGDRKRLAAALATTPPAGFDVCARMESADQAVMKALDRK